MLLLAVTAPALHGCSAESPTGAAAPASSPATTGDSAAGSSIEAKAALPAADAAVTPPPSPGAKTSSPAARELAQAPAAAKPSPPVATPPKAPPVPQPTPEQLAKWGLADKASGPLQLLACYDGFSDALVQCMAIAPDGKQIVLGGARLTLWNAADSQPKADLLANFTDQDVERPILCVGISPDGKWLAAGDTKGRLRIWNRSDESAAALVPAHEGRVTQLAFSPDSKTLATTSYSGEIRLWSMPEGKKLKSLKADKQEVHGLVFVSDTLLATAGSEAVVWNIETGEKSAPLTTGRLVDPALGLSGDRRWLAFIDEDAKTKLWDVEKQAVAPAVLHAGANLIQFSPDGKWIATTGQGTIRIWKGATQTVEQILDTDGGETTALGWLPGNDVLVVATQGGRLRLWGRPDAATALGITPVSQPELRRTAAAAKRSESSAQFEQIFDVRSFPRLPDAVPAGEYGGSSTYNTTAPQAEIEQFYRYTLGKAGWKEAAEPDPARPGLNFQKEGCALNVSVSAAYPVPGVPQRAGEQQVILSFSGNYDARWLPKILPSDSPNTFSGLSFAMSRTKASITDVEVALLKQFHEAGWTPYSRLATSHAEDPRSRSFSMLQGGSVLTVSIGAPSDAADELFVQVGVNISNKSLPIPPDASWIEFDNSTDLKMVATTAMTLPETAAFFDAQMPPEGWIAREAGRKIDEKRGWLPYIRGQRDVLIRLVALPEKEGDTGRGTRILVGDERTSWQLAPAPKAPKDQAGIEAADFTLPKGASLIRFDTDQKQIEFELADAAPAKVGEQFVKQMEDLGWKRDGAGVQADDYVFLTYEMGKAEIQLRARADGAKSSVMVSGNGLLWTKPLPTAPMRISYETWMRHNRKTASLEHLDEFAAEMRKIPADAGRAP